MKQPAEPIENYIDELPLSIRDSDLKKINLPNISELKKINPPAPEKISNQPEKSSN